MVSYGGAGDTNAAKLGLAAEPFPQEMMNNVTIGLTAGFVIAARVRPIKTPVTNLALLLGTAAVTPNGVNAMGVWDGMTGALLARTGDLSAAWSNAANNGLYLPEPLAGGPLAWSTSQDYYIGALAHNATDPLIGVFFAGGGVAYPAVNGKRAVLAISGQTDLPAVLNLAGAGGNAGYWLVGD